MAKKKIQIVLDDEAQEMLAALQTATRSNTMAEVLRDALGVYDWLRHQVADGHRLARIERGTNNIQELLLPSLVQRAPRVDSKPEATGRQREAG